jgi:uncharacterized protein (DUF427 family)
MERNSASTNGTARRLILAWIGVCALVIAAWSGASSAHAMPKPIAGLTGATWATFTDPVSGFSLSYPTSWNLVRAYDGSHITLAHSSTGTTIAPDIVRQSGSVASILNGAATIEGATARHITVDGAQAVDVTQPVLPGSKFNPLGSLITRTITIVPASTARSTTTYTLQLMVKTDARGNLTAQAQADVSTFEGVVQSFRLPRAGVTPTQLNPSPNNCTVPCWADANWNYNIYSDNSSGRDCPTAYNNCVNRTQAPAGRFQPDFQCAEFASRAMAQGYTVPGLINGGQKGFSGTVTGHQGGGWDFGLYSMTTAPYNSTSQYWLVNVGGPGNPSGLYDYLTNNGIGQDDGNNFAAAGWGDVVFFKFGGSSFEHVMLVVGEYKASNGVWHVIVDGHNVDQYHGDVAANDSGGVTLVHIPMDQQDGLTANPTLYNYYNTPPFWSGTNYDGLGIAYHYVGMTGNNNTLTASADLGWSGNPFTSCGIAFYVPQGNATGNVNVTVTEANRHQSYYTVNENNIFGAALVVKPNTFGSPITYVSVDNSGGSTWQDLGVGQFFYFC